MIRRFVHFLAAFAVLVSALLPDGFMLSRGEAGAVEMVICAADGPALIRVGADGMPLPDSEADNDDAGPTCPYALAGTVLLPRLAAVPSRVRFMSDCAVAACAPKLAARRGRRNSNTPRAPPLAL